MRGLHVLAGFVLAVHVSVLGCGLADRSDQEAARGIEVSPLPPASSSGPPASSWVPALTPVSSFGVGGIAEVIGMRDGGSVAFVPMTMAVAKDGAVYVGGWFGQWGFPTGGHAAITRLGPDGAQDMSFGVDGISLLPAPDGYVVDLQVQSDGTILSALHRIMSPGIGGCTRIGCPTDLALGMARVMPSGAPDATFGTDGVVWVSGRYGEQDGNSAGAPFRPCSRLAGGFMYATWSATPATNPTVAPGQRLSRFDHRGIPDPAFGGDAGLAVGSDDYPVAPAVTQDRVYVVSPRDSTLQAFTLEGAPDLRFAGAGWVLTAGGDGVVAAPKGNVVVQGWTGLQQFDGKGQPGWTLPATAAHFTTTAIASSPDGSVFATAFVADGSSVLAHVLVTGLLDPDAGTGGRVQLPATSRGHGEHDAGSSGTPWAAMDTPVALVVSEGSGVNLLVQRETYASPVFPVRSYHVARYTR